PQDLVEVPPRFGVGVNQDNWEARRAARFGVGQLDPGRQGGRFERDGFHDRSPPATTPGRRSTAASVTSPSTPSGCWRSRIHCGNPTTFAGEARSRGVRGDAPPGRHNELTYGEADRRSATTLPRQFVSTSSSRASALSSLVFSASASSLTRICRALASIRFSPADSPRSLSLRQRSLTTSATLFTSPEASFSRLALYRRDQFVGSSVCGARSTSNTRSSPSWPTTSRTPTSSALSAGTRTVRSPLSTFRTR